VDNQPSPAEVDAALRLALKSQLHAVESMIDLAQAVQDEMSKRMARLRDRQIALLLALEK